jgi:hypothetical protein
MLEIWLSRAPVWVLRMSRLPLPDVFTENPDEKSIITYVVAFYHYFSKMKVLAVEGKRVGKVPSCVVGTPVLFVCPL